MDAPQAYEYLLCAMLRDWCAAPHLKSADGLFATLRDFGNCVALAMLACAITTMALARSRK